MTLDNLLQEADILEQSRLEKQAAARLEENAEAKFFQDLNDEAARNDLRRGEQDFVNEVHRVLNRAERARVRQHRIFMLTTIMAAIATVFPASWLAVRLGFATPRIGASAMCLGLLAMGAIIAVAVQEFWPGKGKTQCR